MPYIRGMRARALEDAITELADNIYDDGELNYVFNRLASKFAHKRGIRYELLNRVHGTFFAAAAEFYRKVVAPYEDDKELGPGSVSAEEVFGP